MRTEQPRPGPSAAVLEPPVPAPAGPRPDAARLGWLDALRGVAAVAVALHHAAYHYVPGFRRAMLEWIDPGVAGVLVFFVVSGYIVPASLERGGSVRRFWTGRLFRIHPLLVVALAALLVMHLTGVTRLRDGLDRDFDPVAATLAHLSMLQDLLAVPSAINVLWTLSYEMAFYLIVVALFAVRLHRRSAPIALALAGSGLALAVVLPTAALSRNAGVTPVAIGAAVLMAAAIVLACLPRTRTAGALLGGALAAVLVLLNSRVDPWQGLVLLAFMFTGTAVYRAERGQIRVRTAALTAAGVLAAALAGGAWRLHAWGPEMTEWGVKRAWLTAVVLAAALFGLGLALRHRRMPRALVRLGVISYSVYLLHPVLLMGLDATVGRPDGDDPGYLLLFLALLIALSELAYRCVERPMQNVGRRVGRRLDAAPAAQTVPA
ncbi:acyltransferase family protein [Actinomadura hibisca]|uniref:acyltransferase family protein n=1 Tax=Actinomadura hibisca TaxID=68565 RepID=UPI001FE22532|nr:acyltransferase [Actinomadura hibisca]